MSDLGRFLEVVFGPQDPFRTVQGALRYWCNKDLADKASENHRHIGRRKAPAPGDLPTFRTADATFFLEVPDRLRIEKTVESEGGVERSLAIVNRERWWSRDGEGRVETDEVNSSPRRRTVVPAWNDVERHFCPAALREYFVGLALEPIGAVQTAGRDCIRLRAVRRAEGQIWPHWLPHGADEYEFHADPERGALLHIVGRFEGEAFESYEVTEVHYDGPLDESLFIYQPGPEEQLRSAGPIVEEMTLADAVARMPFVVLKPTSMPDRKLPNPSVIYRPPRPPSRRSQLALMYHGECSVMIFQADSADPSMSRLEWAPCGRDGIEMAISEPAAPGGKRLLTLERHGTHVTIVSNLNRQELSDLAASLTPA